jgi:glycosyltransferase involved in cell wall biosynthesis
MLVTIGTPHANNFTAEYVIGLAATLVQAPYPIEVRHNEGSFIYFNRNLIFNRAEGDYLMFIDADMVFQPYQIWKLVESGKDIIGGLYYSRRKPYGPTVFYDVEGVFREVDPIPQEPFLCDGLGTGFMLISRKVIDCFKNETLPREWGLPFDPLLNEVGCEGSMLDGEDLSFCKKARHLGFEVWCDPTVIVGHVGKQIVWGPQ